MMNHVKASVVARFAKIVAPHRRLLILTHGNPDPDALASASALGLLARKIANTPSVIAYAGFLTRPENRQMVSLLRLRAVPVSSIDLRRFRAIVLVDAQPSAGNVSLPPKTPLVAVVDHHGLRRASLVSPFHLIDPGVGATSTICHEMLRASRTTIPPNIATALFYGIKTDTLDLGREATQRDVAAYEALFPLVARRKLALITHPRLPREYYRVLHRAVEAAVVYRDCVYSPVGPVSTPEYLSAVADYLVSLEGMRWAVATGVFDGNLYFSLRTLTARKDSAAILRSAVSRHGFAGGHRKMAGGLLLLSQLDENERLLVESKVVSALLASLSADTNSPCPLLSPGPPAQ